MKLKLLSNPNPTEEIENLFYEKASKYLPKC